MAGKQTGITMDMYFITELLREAGREILMPAFQHQSHKAYTKHDGTIVTDTDLTCQKFLREQLAVLYSEIGFVGEEMSKKNQLSCMKENHRFWCLDPLDGTTNFVTSLPVFGISLALIEGGQPVFACIHDPVRDEIFSAVRNEGAWLNQQPLKAVPVKSLSESVGFIDFKRIPYGLATYLATKECYRSQRNIGSCVLEWAWLATGRAQFIIHGNEKLWDYAAGCLLAEEAGCIVSDFKQQHPFHAKSLGSSIIAATSATVHQQLLRLPLSGDGQAPG